MPEDNHFTYENVRIWVREHLVELDDQITNQDILYGYRVASPMAWDSLEELALASVHCCISRTDDLSGETMKISIGGIARSYRPMSGRAGASFWMTTEYGRQAIALKRSNPRIASASLPNE